MTSMSTTFRRVVNIGRDEIFLMRARRFEGRCERYAFYIRIAFSQQFVGAVLNPLGHVGVGGTAIGRVILEAAILRRVVRRRDDDAVREMLPGGRGCTRGSPTR